MKTFVRLGIGFAALLLLANCTPSPGQLKKVIEKHPDIVFNAIEKHPTEFLDSVNKAANMAREQQAKNEMAAEQKERQEEYKHPLQPVIDPHRAILGKADAPITIVEYSDYQCPFCLRGFHTMQQVLQTYGDKIRFLYKDLPLVDLHPQAMTAAEYYEAIALQSTKKALKYHDLLFENHDALVADGMTKPNIKFFDKMARKVGANMALLKKDLKSPEVQQRIQADEAEAKKFGFTGTPGFLINGVALKGAYPFADFKQIIDHFLNKKS